MQFHDSARSKQSTVRCNTKKENLNEWVLEMNVSNTVQIVCRLTVILIHTKFLISYIRSKLIQHNLLLNGVFICIYIIYTYIIYNIYNTISQVLIITLSSLPITIQTIHKPQIRTYNQSHNNISLHTN